MTVQMDWRMYLQTFSSCSKIKKLEFTRQIQYHLPEPIHPLIDHSQRLDVFRRGNILSLLYACNVVGLDQFRYNELPFIVHRKRSGHAYPTSLSSSYDAEPTVSGT